MKITLCVDKQNRGSASEELKEYIIDIGCPLRSVDDVFDELKISTDDNNVLVGQITRRCYVDEYGVLKKLSQEEIQELDVPDIELFEGTNYVYIKEFTTLNMKLEYLTNAEMNKYFATKREMNSSIKQTADSINLNVSTKADKTELQSAIEMLDDQITLAVSTKADKTELQSAINILNGSIQLKVSKNDIISSINLSPESITIDANKLGLTANDVINLISGKAINLSSKNISITSNNFSVDAFGNMVCNNATINGGSMNITKGDGSAIISLHDTRNGNNLAIYGSRMEFTNNNDSGDHMEMWNNALNMTQGTFTASIYPDNIAVNHGSSYTYMTADGGVVHSSRAEYKKDIEKVTNNLKLIKDCNVYSFLFKEEKEDAKKHIGLIIGEKYNTPDVVMNADKTGIELYNMTAVMWGAIKEQQEIIEKLESRIDELEKKVNTNE